MFPYLSLYLGICHVLENEYKMDCKHFGHACQVIKPTCELLWAYLIWSLDTQVHRKLIRINFVGVL
jgi:hypothetical protein